MAARMALRSSLPTPRRTRTGSPFRNGRSRTAPGHLPLYLTVRHFFLTPRVTCVLIPLIGHGGDVTVNYIVEALPAELKGRLASLVSFTSPVQADAVGTTIHDSITHVDDGLQRDLLALFPGGVDSLGKMTDDEIKAIINDKERGAVNITKLLRAQHGSTALIALQDPSRENLWIAGLGDCSASTCPNLGSYARVLTA
jgi:hypothetical protein